MEILKRFLGIIFFALVIYACVDNEVYHGSVDFEDKSWNLSNEPSLDVNIVDTAPTYNIYVEVRNTPSFETSNLWVMVSCKRPNGAVTRDTVNCILADQRGAWLGKGLGDLYATRHLLKENVRFFDRGLYKFSFVHGMRSMDVKGVSDVGISIEKFIKK